MAIKYELIAKSGTYKDPNSGDEKTRWVKCGVVMAKAEWQLRLNLCL
jgi:hypothetical protein